MIPAVLCVEQRYKLEGGCIDQKRLQNGYLARLSCHHYPVGWTLSQTSDGLAHIPGAFLFCMSKLFFEQIWNHTMRLCGLAFSPLQSKPFLTREQRILLLYFLLAQLTSGHSRCPGIFVDTLTWVLVKGMNLSHTFSQPIKGKNITHLRDSFRNDFLSLHLSSL